METTLTASPKNDLPPLDRYLEYRGHLIVVTERYRFVVSGPDWPEKPPTEEKMKTDWIGFDSLNAAKKAIDDQLLVDARQKVKEATLAIPVLHEDGRTDTVRGIHRGTGNMLFGAEKEPRDSSSVYPMKPWLLKMLQQRREHQRHIDTINSTVRKVGTRIRRVYGKLSVEEYETRVALLVRELQEAEAKADELFAEMVKAE